MAGGEEIQAITADAREFGVNVFVYCRQHLRPHRTNWCTVGLKDKVKLDAKSLKEAFEECKQNGFKVAGENGVEGNS